MTSLETSDRRKQAILLCWLAQLNSYQLPGLMDRKDPAMWASFL